MEKTIYGKGKISPTLAVIPLAALILFVLIVIMAKGASSVVDYAPLTLLGASVVAVIVAAFSRSLRWKALRLGQLRSARQVLSSIPLLASIGFISTTWMLSGIVPGLIHFGISVINADFFLPIVCAVCAVISVLLGSSWTTIATIGVAFMSIGTVFGYDMAWTAGAIISGAYFGDKVSPLSDTTVLASASCGVDIMIHIRNLMSTTMPAMLVATAIYTVAGLSFDTHTVEVHAADVMNAIESTFNLSPWLAAIPVITVALCVLRVPSLYVLMISGTLGIVAMFIFQPVVVGQLLSDQGIAAAVVKLVAVGFDPATSSAMLNELVATSGVAGMIPTIVLVLSAMVFGGTLIGTGILSVITHMITSRIRRRSSIVAATAATGLTLNAMTADQYLSIIIGSNVYRNAYRRSGFEPKLLSRTLEDSVSVTSVLIPWNACGITQSTVLGVATLAYMPFCFFNYLSPLFTVLVSLLPQRSPRRRTAVIPA